MLEIGGGSTITVNGLIWVKSGGTIIAKGKNVTEQIDGEWAGEGVSFTANSITVEAGGFFHADGQGYVSSPVGSYNAGGGPGGIQPGQTVFTVNKGASHGGLASASNGDSEPVYGSMREPVELGSSSLGFQSTEEGGGAIRLIVSDTLTVDGFLSANGTSTGINHNGASGGSIWVTTNVLAGSGQIQANASDKGTASANQSSSGGRVAIYYSDASGFADLSKIEANASVGENEVEDGTVWLEKTVGGKRHLTVFGRIDLAENDQEPLDSITVGNSGVVEIPGGADVLVNELFHIMDGGTVVAESINSTDRVDGEWQGEGVTFSVSSFTIDAGGVFTADGKGYEAVTIDGSNVLGTGPGGTINSSLGPSYGGQGGTNFTSQQSPLSYGSPFEPTDLGSSGFGFLSNTFGGGAIRLIISDSLTVNGTLSANGLAEGTNYHGATGGSIWINTDVLAGSGIIQANASNKGPVSTNRHGGGGRIALYYSDASGFSELRNVEAKSGGDDDNSEDGTVFLLDVDNGDGDLTLSGRLDIPEDVFRALESVSILGTGLLEIFGGATLRVNGVVDVASGGQIVFRSKGLKKNYKDEWVGEGSNLFAGTLNVPAGAAIGADGQGYLEGPGSELRQFVNVAGSHGGLGSGPVEPIYGSETMPLTPGSGGGAGTLRTRE